jgi:geranylgeranyl diphosphate synthase type I
MQSADAEQAEALRDGLGDRGLDVDRVDELCEIIRATGALDQVEQRITERTAEACDALRDAPISEASRAALETLAGLATDRHA